MSVCPTVSKDKDKDLFSNRFSYDKNITYNLQILKITSLIYFYYCVIYDYEAFHKPEVY